MESNKTKLFVRLIIMLLIFSGCALTGDFVNWNDTSELDELHDQLMLTYATLVTYIDKSKEDVRRDYGEPTDIEYGAWSSGVQFDERWDYVYQRGIPMINAYGSIKSFFFKDGIVKEVNAF